MLNSVEIENYKSINKLSLALGRVNLFIGENGCGKSNILEVLCLASCAEASKLDNNFLSSRGVRVTSAELMRANFDRNNSELPITIRINNNEQLEYILENDNKPYSAWSYKKNNNDFTEFKSKLEKSFKDDLRKKQNEGIIIEKGKIEFLYETDAGRDIIDNILKNGFDLDTPFKNFNDFVIYSPENSALRNFYEEGQLEPLGVNGAGLLKLLKVINETDEEGLKDIKEALDLFGWYADIDIPDSLDKSNDKISITDKYIETIIDQRSANEGFLFVLFYVALIVSKDTPKIFAIDNVDASLNPKLCTKIMELIVQLCTKYDKQVFLTTHNPAILDGLNVHDEQQCLFVISRNNDGYTKAKKVSSKKSFQTADGGTLKFSEAFLRGYLNALPKGF